MTRSTTAFGPVSATLVLLAAGPLTIWSLVMFLMLVTGAVNAGFAGPASYLGLLVFSFLGALACRRAINVLRTQQGGVGKRSRWARAVMLTGIVAVAQVPVTMFSNESFGDALNGPVKLMLLGGMAAAIGGGLFNLMHRRQVVKS